MIARYSAQKSMGVCVCACSCLVGKCSWLWPLSQSSVTSEKQSPLAFPMGSGKTNDCGAEVVTGRQMWLLPVSPGTL